MQTEMMKLRELTVRYSVKKTDAGQPVIVGRAMNTPRESASAVMTVLRDLPGEVFADRKSTRLNSSHIQKSRMPSSA